MFPARSVGVRANICSTWGGTGQTPPSQGVLGAGACDPREACDPSPRPWGCTLPLSLCSRRLGQERRVPWVTGPTLATGPPPPPPPQRRKPLPDPEVHRTPTPGPLHTQLAQPAPSSLSDSMSFTLQIPRETAPPPESWALSPRGQWVTETSPGPCGVGALRRALEGC